MSDDPVAAQKGPYQVALEKGKSYAWCSCGKSAKQPFCDGTHKGSSFTPMRFTAEKDGVQNLCGCKATEDKPFCDGGHNML